MNHSEIISFAQFLEEVRPHDERAVLFDLNYSQGLEQITCSVPDIKLYCQSNCCNNIQKFNSFSEIIECDHHEHYHTIEYSCYNCRETEKRYSIYIPFDEGEKTLPALKIGEMPSFRVYCSNKTLNLIGSDREFFIKGLECERSGLGLGAFSYYRRVVENQKTKIIDALIKISTLNNEEEDLIQFLENAKRDFQFQKSIKQVKKALPESILIQGHNPLTLLHNALSQGIHNDSDKDCLEIAESIRELLAELSKRISDALENKEKLRSAIHKINMKNSKN